MESINEVFPCTPSPWSPFKMCWAAAWTSDERILWEKKTLKAVYDFVCTRVPCFMSSIASEQMQFVRFLYICVIFGLNYYVIMFVWLS